MKAQNVQPFLSPCQSTKCSVNPRRRTTLMRFYSANRALSREMETEIRFQSNLLLKAFLLTLSHFLCLFQWCETNLWTFHRNHGRCKTITKTLWSKEEQREKDWKKLKTMKWRKKERKKDRQKERKQDRKKQRKKHTSKPTNKKANKQINNESNKISCFRPVFFYKWNKIVYSKILSYYREEPHEPQMIRRFHAYFVQQPSNTVQSCWLWT